MPSRARPGFAWASPAAPVAATTPRATASRSPPRPRDENYHFSHWVSDGGGSFEDDRSAQTTFVMPGHAVTVIAHYTPGVAMTDDVSVARRWNELLLQAIRNDYARPTVHARNLFHVSAAMYDAWAAFDDVAESWLSRAATGLGSRAT